jgi:hypothetical protein
MRRAHDYSGRSEIVNRRRTSSGRSYVNDGVKSIVERRRFKLHREAVQAQFGFRLRPNPKTD